MKTSLHLIGVVLSIFIGGQMLARPLEEEQKKSVEADAEVQSNLARMRGNGGGVPKDSADGVKRYLKAAEDGHAPFRSFLGSLYGSGDRYSAADLKWYQEAARQGNVVAQFGLGVMYAKGEGVSKDSVEAVNWLRKAADQEDRSAQLLLGLMYAEGNGVPKDSVEAVKWYRKAGEQGYRTAQFLVGLMYANGEGVPRDATEAVHWFRKSADQGDAIAQRTLGWIYGTGEGVPKDSAEAAKWFRKAAGEAGGNEWEVATLRGHTDWVTAVAFSPDSRRLVTGCVDTTAKVWDLTNGRELFTVSGRVGGVWSVAYSPDGREFLTGGGDGVRLWDAETGRLVLTFPPSVERGDWLESGALWRPRESHGDRVEVVAFSPDGRRVLTVSNAGKVIVWDAATGDSLLTLSPAGYSAIHAAAFSPDGLTIAIGAYTGKISFLDARCGHELLSLAGHTNAIESLAYFPDGSRIVTASYDRTARIWDTRLGREVLVFRGHQGLVTSVAVSPDGRRVVTGSSDCSAKVWDAETGEERLFLQGNREAIDAVAFSPDGTRVATTSMDRMVKIWDVKPKSGAAIAGALSEARLESGYLPLTMRLHGDPSNREIRSVRFVGKVPPEGDGAGEIWLDTRQAELSSFGDVVRRVGPEPTPIRVELRYIATSAGQTTNHATFPGDSQASQGFRLYDLVLPGGVLGGSLQLVLGTANLGPHRLLAYSPAPFGQVGSAKRLGHILFLYGDPPIKSALPDTHLGQEIDLTGYYTGVDGRIRRLKVRGALDGAGKLAYDPNHITFDRFGEPVMFTCIGYQPHEITLEPVGGTDPLGKGRRLYWVVSKDPRNTNRVAVVLGRTEIGPHRVLLYRGSEVALTVPVELADRRSQVTAAAELTSVSVGEQQAVVDLRQSIGYGFGCQIEKGQVVGLNFYSSRNGSFPPEGVLARLPHLVSIYFDGGQFPEAGLVDLNRLARLCSLSFNGVTFSARTLATLKDLSQLERLYFRDCRGITDEGVKHLVGLTQLKALSFYSEQLLRPGEAQSQVTDAGVTYLKQLVRLEELDLFGHDLSDRSVEVLTGMNELQDLTLSGHGFTNAGLDGLARLSKLRNLRLFETAVTTNGVAALKQRLPNVNVNAWGRDSHD